MLCSSLWLQDQLLLPPQSPFTAFTFLHVKFKVEFGDSPTPLGCNIRSRTWEARTSLHGDREHGAPGAALPPPSLAHCFCCVLSGSFSNSLFLPGSLFSALTPHAPLHPRNQARLDLPSPSPTCPWSLLRASLRSPARAGSGHTPPPRPGSKVARPRGDRYRNLSRAAATSSSSPRHRGWDEAGDGAVPPSALAGGQGQCGGDTWHGDCSMWLVPALSKGSDGQCPSCPCQVPCTHCARSGQGLAPPGQLLASFPLLSSALTSFLSFHGSPSSSADGGDPPPSPAHSGQKWIWEFLASGCMHTGTGSTKQ